MIQINSIKNNNKNLSPQLSELKGKKFSTD